MATTKDIVEDIKADHKIVTKLLDNLASQRQNDRDQQFCELVHFLVGHEVAEEEVVYPALRRTGSDGERVAEARVEEQSKAEELLSKMEDMSSDTKMFTEAFERLRSAVQEHAEAEEREVLPRLSEHLNQGERADLARRYEAALEAAPTHPHPHAPDQFPANVVAGTVAAVVDRVRDSLKETAQSS